MTMYSGLIYTQPLEGEGYQTPQLPATFGNFLVSSVSWNPYSTNPLDRTEYWEDTEGTLTLEQAEAAATSNASGQYNKERAKALLLASDWTELPSVSNPNSLPYLTNVSEFVTYRSALRILAVMPPIGTAVFPLLPACVWAQ